MADNDGVEREGHDGQLPIKTLIQIRWAFKVRDFGVKKTKGKKKSDQVD